MLKLIIIIFICFVNVSFASLSGDIYVSNAAGLGLMKSSSFFIENFDDHGNSIVEGQAFINYNNEINFNFLVGYNLFDYLSIETAARMTHAEFNTNIPTNINGLQGGFIENALKLLSVSAGINYELKTTGIIIPIIGIFAITNQTKFFDAKTVTTGFGGKIGVDIILNETIHAFTFYEASFIKKPFFSSVANSVFSEENNQDSNGTDSSIKITGNKQCAFQDNFVRSIFTLGLKFIM